ncbi:MAG: VWA domain-containing protein [Acidobacteriia bacterium]|nr:VWA domain-containing protein [Terriglobia bacterium]MYC68052.1 VWA domain-containing protein [Terriglobia bacterium]
MRPLALLLPALLALLPVVAQDAETTEGGPTFSLDVKVVNLLATVKDRSGRLLSTLTKDDFILSEDGVRQEIRYFSHQTDLPLTIGLLIDTSGSQRALISAERSAGLMFFRSILRKDKDLAFLMSFDRNVELLQDYTASLGLLERGLDELQVEVPTSGLHPGPGGDKQPTSTALNDALYLAADEMFRNQVGRKAVVVISDGYDYGSKISLKRAIEAAQRADVVVYTIQYVDRHFAGRAYFNVGSGAGALKRMSEQTGGSAFRVSRGIRLAGIFQQIEDELRGQYSIGYTPKRGLDSPGFRKISLKAAGKGLKIQARNGYYADAI